MPIFAFAISKPMRVRLVLRPSSSSLRRQATASWFSSAANGQHRRAAASGPRRPWDQEQESEASGPLVPLLALPESSYALFAEDVHCFLGLNGSGKTRLLNQLQQAADATISQGGSSRCRVSSLSLDAHRAFVAQHGDRIVADVLGGVGSPTARDLIVRLGLFPVWESHVRHLSTGEIRKVMLAVTLLQVPKAKVLILDQPFDGLDVAARAQLQWMLTQLTRGFTRLLVETGFGRNTALAYKTQVLLVANRLEQVFPDILSHIVLLNKQQQSEDSKPLEIVPWVFDDVKQAEGSETMMEKLRGFLDLQNEATRTQMDDSEIVELVQKLFDCNEGSEKKVPHPAVELSEVSIAYDRRVLLDAVDFARHSHDHWVLLGPNGSGKSSLMRVLMQTPGHGLSQGQVRLRGVDVLNDVDSIRVEAISTDQHIHLLHQSVSDKDDLTSMPTAQGLISENAKSEEKAQLASQLLALDPSLLARSFAELSQGEQKLVLIARALAACPQVLILDEITHGLDPFNRAHVLRVINSIGTHASHETHLILITHHEDEITECFSGVFEIKDKQLVERRPEE